MDGLFVPCPTSLSRSPRKEGKGSFNSLIARYKAQCPVQDVHTKNYVVTLGHVYKQCTLNRQCKTKALVANMQLLFCFRLETYN